MYMKKILFCGLAIIGIFILTLFGCKGTDPIEGFYDKYELSHVKCNYYDNGISRSNTYLNPHKNILLGSTEQNEFYNEVYDFLGTFLTFNNKFITFGGKYPVEYSYSDISDDGSFRFKFNNIFGEQTGTSRKYMCDGRTSVWLDYVNNTVESRQITISSTLYIDGQGRLDFKPVATFEFVFSNNIE